MQIVKRLGEWDSTVLTKKNVNGVIDTNKNSWFQVDDGYFHVKEVAGLVVTGQFYSETWLHPFFDDFLSSVDVGIVMLAKSAPGHTMSISKNDLCRKCVCIRYKDSYVLIPLLNDFR